MNFSKPPPNFPGSLRLAPGPHPPYHNPPEPSVPRAALTHFTKPRYPLLRSPQPCPRAQLHCEQPNNSSFVVNGMPLQSSMQGSNVSHSGMVHQPYLPNVNFVRAPAPLTGTHVPFRPLYPTQGLHGEPIGQQAVQLVPLLPMHHQPLQALPAYPPPHPQPQHFSCAESLPVVAECRPSPASLGNLEASKQSQVHPQQTSVTVASGFSIPTNVPPPLPVPAPHQPIIPFPPPSLSKPPPPLVSPPLGRGSGQPSPVPRYDTPPKTPVTQGPPSLPMFLSPPPPYKSSLVQAAYPLTPGPGPHPHPPAPPPPQPSIPAPACEEIPDLRHQFLSNQLLPAPGQVVLLPPLPHDRSVQTIQLLTPGVGGHFTVQTIILPIIKMNQNLGASATSWTVDKSTVSQQSGGDQVKQIPQPGNNHILTQPVKSPVNTDDLLHQSNITSSRTLLQSLNPPLISTCDSKEMVGEDEDFNEDGILLNQVDATGLPSVMQGVDLEKVKSFASQFKMARLQLGLTQTQVGQALTGSSEEHPVSQSTICRFEKLEITALQVKKLLPQLQRWLANAQDRHAAGLPVVNSEYLEGPFSKESKKRKKRTVFNQETVEILNKSFGVCPAPSAQAITDLADKLGFDRETVRVWFCNKRQQNKKNSHL